jgi:hypothetical protein
MQMPNDGPFKLVRKWYGQFYDSRENAPKYLAQAGGIHHVPSLEKPGDRAHAELEEGLFGA